MRVTYDWTKQDWDEAVTLATETPRRRGSVPGMVYALVGIPLIGAVLDGVRSVRGTGRLTGAGMAVPVLLLLLAVVLCVGFFVARMERRKRVRLTMPMPAGQWEAVLQEAGWRFEAKSDDVPTEMPSVAAATPPPVEETADAVVQEAPAPEVVPVAAVTVAPVETEAVMPSKPAADEPDAGAPAASAAEAVENVVVVAPVSAIVPLKGPVHAIARLQPAVAVTGKDVAAVAVVDMPVIATVVDVAAVAVEDVPVAVAVPRPPAEAAKVEAAAEEKLPAVPETLPEEAAVVATDTPKADSPTKTDAALHPWKDLTSSRAGDRAVVFLHNEGFHAVPIRCMTPEQAGHLHRMVVRKLRPAPTPVPHRMPR